MKLHSVQRCRVLLITLHTAWDYFSTAVNLKYLTPRNMDMRIISQLPDSMYPGMIIEYKIKPPAHNTLDRVTEITQFREFEYFIDEQRLGPYALTGILFISYTY